MELSLANWTELAATDGHRLQAWRAEPQGKPRGGLVVVQEIFGVNGHIRSVAEGFAAEGYLVLAPALFDRIGPGIELGYTPDDIARGRELKGELPVETALLDIAPAIASLKADTAAVGVVGYCWGGQLSWASACRLEGLSAAVCYYGGGIAAMAEEQPKCPVMFHFGEHDKAIPMSDVEAIRAAHPEQTLHTYPADHGFNCDQRGSYDADSATLARERTISFLARHLG